MWRSSRAITVAIAIAVLAVLGAAYAFRSRLAVYALTKGVGAATGTQLRVGRLTLHSNRATLENVVVSAHHGERLAFIPRVEIRYDLHDLLPGSRHLYGLHAVTVYRPRITVVRNPDGTYNLPALAKKTGAKKSAAPMNLHLRVLGGSLALIEGRRRIVIGNLDVRAAIDTAARTQYTASMAYESGAARYPIYGRGVIDKQLGLDDQHWTAAHVPLAQLVDYALHNPKIRVEAGALDKLNVRYYGKLSASAYLRGGRVRMQGVSSPLENVHGPLEVTSAGLTTPHLDAAIAGAPIHVRGAIYNLSHPTFRLIVHAHGQAARLKHLTAAAAKLPLRGPLDLAVLVEGTLRSPLAMILMHSPAIYYRAMPLRNPNGLLAFDGRTATIVNFGVQYGGFTLGARGRMALVREPDALDAFATLRGPSDQIPYASSFIPGMTLQGTVLATGGSLKQVDAHGVLTGSGPRGRLASVFDFTSRGVGAAVVHAPSLYAKAALDRPKGKVDALVRANGLALRPAPAAALPGLRVKGLPPASGTVDGVVFATRGNGALGLLGNVRAHGVRYGKISIASAHARFGGAPGNVRVASLDARGNFGSIRAAGSIAGTNHVALEGRYTGSLSQISSIAGNVPANGVVDAPIALVYDGGRAVAQVRNARLSNTSVRGIAVDGLSATIGLRPASGAKQQSIDVYAARARIAHGATAVAAGSLGNGGRLAFAVSQFPVAGGYANAAATATGALNAPSVRGALLLTGAHYLHYAIGGASAFTYAGGTAVVRDAMIDAGPALALADGTVWPHYNLQASASGLVSYKQFTGSIDADVHVAGSGTAPRLAGSVDIPAGNVQGLPFRNLRANVAGTPKDFQLRNGAVQIGSTAMTFDAAVAPDSLRAAVDAPRADLADFNPYFNTGDTLAGTGRLALQVAMTPFTLASSGNVNLSGVRYRRFDIGRTRAAWQTSGTRTSLDAFVGGAHGTASIAGTVVPREKLMNLNASVRGFDLENWLPLLGLRTPVAGYVNANARLYGRYPDVALDARANLRDGVIGRIHVQRAQIAATARHGRGRITQAYVQIPYFTATGSGTFGLHRNDRLQLALRGTSPDIGKLLQTYTGKPNELAGALDAALRVNGTAQKPVALGALTLSNLRYAKFTVPTVSANLRADKTAVALTRGTIDLRKGTIAITGRAPLHAAGSAPISLALTANNVDLSDFGSALPSGTTIAGTLDGALRLGGTIRAPLMSGSMALRNGYFVGPIDQNPISAANADLVFSGTRVALKGVRAKVGGGTLAMTGSAAVPTLRDLRALTFDSTIVAKGAQVNSPQYFRGKFNADVRAYRVAGGLPTIAGSVDVPTGRIPLTAFWNPHAKNKPKHPPIDLAFDLKATAGRDVRVQSSNVDVGARGTVRVTGTMKKPALSGQVVSTGGSVDFLRRFQIQSARIGFTPADGYWPRINAVATTQVGSPPTYVQLRVTGLAPNAMQLALQSDPSYSRSQILALLAGVGGQNTNGFTLGGAVQNLALGQLNNLFTRNLFEPLDVGLGNALGLQNLQISDSFTSGFGVSAVKAFGKHVTATFSQNLGEPKEQLFSLQAHRSDSTAYQLMLYNVQDPPLLGFLSQNNNPFKLFNAYNEHSTMMAVSGTNGFTLTYVRKFH